MSESKVLYKAISIKEKIKDDLSIMSPKEQDNYLSEVIHLLGEIMSGNMDKSGHFDKSISAKFGW